MVEPQRCGDEDVTRGCRKVDALGGGLGHDARAELAALDQLLKLAVRLEGELACGVEDDGADTVFGGSLQMGHYFQKGADTRSVQANGSGRRCISRVEQADLTKSGIKIEQGTDWSTGIRLGQTRTMLCCSLQGLKTYLGVTEYLETVVNTRTTPQMS